MPWHEVKLTMLQQNIADFCCRPYPDHPHGCPMYGVKEGCPGPGLRPELGIDLTKTAWVIWNEFDLAGHVARLREKHPAWSERRLRCCLYWQQGARADLEKVIQEFFRIGDVYAPCIRIVRTPEACRVNVTATMRDIGLELFWPPRNIAYQVAVAGYLTGTQSAYFLRG